MEPTPSLRVPLLDAQPTVVMSNCIHNQLESLGQRYLKVTPKPKAKFVNNKLVLRIVDFLTDKISLEFKKDFSFKQYVMEKPGAVRKRFLRAYKQMSEGSRNITLNSKITAFVKNERYFEEDKSPRMIMGRDPRFNIIYARFICRLEDAFFKLKQVANACDFAKCGSKFADLLALCGSMFENDMSKYEATQRKCLLGLEYLVYSGVFKRCGCEGEIEDLKTVFAAKCMKPVITGSGVKASFEWCRGSGDLDTGLGNGVINFITTMYFMCINYCPLGQDCHVDGSCCSWFDKFVLKGDDSYGVSPKSDLKNTYEFFGLDAKLIYRHDATETEFCSGGFVRVSDGRWTYVQKLKKLLTSVSTIINPDIIANGWVGHYVKSLGLMYSVLYKGIPVYEDFAKMLCTVDNGLGINTSLIEGVSYGAWDAFKATKGNTAKVASCPETILDISTTNGMPIAQLEALVRTFQETKLLLPEHLHKRCNKKNKPDKGFEDPGDIINRWVVNSELSKEAKSVRRMLTKIEHDRSCVHVLFSSDPD